MHQWTFCLKKIKLSEPLIEENVEYTHASIGFVTHKKCRLYRSEGKMKYSKWTKVAGFEDQSSAVTSNTRDLNKHNVGRLLIWKWVKVSL